MSGSGNGGKPQQGPAAMNTGPGAAPPAADNGSGSSDLVEEAVVGNVNKLLVLPPNQTLRPRKGDLIFDACFESGNLGRVDYVNEYEYDLFVRPDTCNPRFRVWFNFTVENVKCDQRVIFNIVNFSKTKSLYREGMAPLVKSTSRPRWHRIPAKHVYYYRCPDHHRNYIMSFAFCFDREDDIYQFSYCYPYTYTRLQKYLDSLDKLNKPFIKRELLALSVQQRRLDLLTITHPSNLGTNRGGAAAVTNPNPSSSSATATPSAARRIVFITARVHPGETPASYVCQGLVDFLVSSNPVARTLRKYLVFKVVPMLNPDGVYLGNYRCSLMGFDLNRHWHEPSPWAHPTLHASKTLLMEYEKAQDVDLDFYIDIHAHSTLLNGFMYGNLYEDTLRHEQQSIFPKLFGFNADDFSLPNTNFNKDIIKAGTGRRYLGSYLDKSSCYTLEVSFYGYNSSKPGLDNTVIHPYTEESYMRLGRNLARTFADYYKLIGYIPDEPQMPQPMSSLAAATINQSGGSGGSGQQQQQQARRAGAGGTSK